MRRISTLFFVLFFAAFSTSAVHAQLTCTIIQGNNCLNSAPFTSGTVTQTFDSPLPSGWTLVNFDRLPTASGNNPNYDLESANASTSTLTTPYYNFGASCIRVSFTINVTQSGTGPTGIVISFISSRNPGLLTCTARLSNGGKLSGQQCVEICGYPFGSSDPSRLQIGFEGTDKIAIDNLSFGPTVSQAALPVNFVNFQAKKVSNGMQLTWDVANEDQLNRYEVEKSSDGRNFSTLSTVATLGQSTYNYTDASPLSGTVYYRIRSVDNNGSYKYSTVLKFDNGRASVVLKVFPQPAFSTIIIQHATALQGALITISSGDGKVVKTIVPSTSAMQTPVDLSNLRAGMYLLRYDDGAGSIETTKIVKQ